ncbi:MAG: D,D-heptose 1,7-bisphosphate phosphatase [Promethearchaeota archaeon Loki_b31]|jgi:D,D-heptose 1,7-bisphosphate phosphatase|nr:MAG: D,D-heptose 1,7-bisphosphate phosphatase [Candidatus Lokiarchaeota archaeon Loki_b31]
MGKIKAIILDRDGTLIEDKDYAYKIEDFELLPGVIEGLKILQKNFLLFIVTNQSGIGRGYYTDREFHKFNDYLIGILKENQIRIERTFYCPHVKEDNCECKKPKIKFIREIVDGWNVDINNSWVIGDHPSDILFGINARCNTVYMSTGHGERHLNELEVEGITPTYISNNFLKAALEIVRVK